MIVSHHRGALPPAARRRRLRVLGGLVLLLAALLLAFSPAARDALLSPFGWRAHASAHPTRNPGLLLGWTAARGAKSYVVRFLGADGKEIDRIDGIETLEVVLTREALPRRLKPGSTVLWTVVALAPDGRERGHSPPQPLKLP